MAYYELHLVEPVIQVAMRRFAETRGPDGIVWVDVVPLIHATLTEIAAREAGAGGVDAPERKERFRQLVLALSTATTGGFSATSPADAIRLSDAARPPSHRWSRNACRLHFIVASLITHNGARQPAPRFSRTPGYLARHPPRLGEHAEAVLADWGVTAS